MRTDRGKSLNVERQSFEQTDFDELRHKYDGQLDRISGYHVSTTDFVMHPCHVFRCPPVNFLISQLGTLLPCDEEILDQISTQNPSDSLQMRLAQRGFGDLPNKMVPRQTDETKPYPVFFMIDLIRQCNLRCSYCFRDMSNQDEMKPDALDSVLDFMIAYCRKHKPPQIVIQPWGGEPLLALDRIERIYRKMSSESIAFTLVLETNGTLITPSVAKQLLTMGVRLGISIDGPSELHNHQRPLLNGKPSFKAVMQGINRLREAGYTKDSFGVIAILTRNTRQHLPELLDFIATTLEHTNFKLNIVRPNPSLTDPSLVLSPDEFANTQLWLIDQLITRHYDGCALIEENIRQKLHNLLYRRNSDICRSRGCQGGVKLISFAVDGGIYPCELTDFPEMRIGHIDSGDLVDTVAAAKNDHIFFRQPRSTTCLNCAWKPFCGGGCKSSIYMRTGQLSPIDPYECTSAGITYPALLASVVKHPAFIQACKLSKQ